MFFDKVHFQNSLHWRYWHIQYSVEIYNDTALIVAAAVWFIHFFSSQTGRKEKGDPLNSAIDKMTKKTRDLRRQVCVMSFDSLMSFSNENVKLTFVMVNMEKKKILVMFYECRQCPQWCPTREQNIILLCQKLPHKRSWSKVIHNRLCDLWFKITKGKCP